MFYDYQRSVNQIVDRRCLKNLLYGFGYYYLCGKLRSL